ncbi:unnamed protein product [Onchocerca ochengi]|uniref:ATP-dependent DNA helicase n=1 Tax=Onchocerca ochengi TaxID=42157 RepID=A0A182E4Z4_ONCOC|nr:unnamed protein product [Onchocerca ochengi]
MPSPNRSAAASLDVEVRCEQNCNTTGLLSYVQSNIPKLNVLGGTGKMSLIKLILATIRSQNDIALSLASSGIAATLLPEEEMLIRFGIAIEHTVHRNSHMQHFQNIRHGKSTAKCKLIVWYEFMMTQKESIEVLDRLLQDSYGNIKSFGNALILLAKDFSLQNDRLAGILSHQLLEIGNGKMPVDLITGRISLPHNFYNLVTSKEEAFGDLRFLNKQTLTFYLYRLAGAGHAKRGRPPQTAEPRSAIIVGNSGAIMQRESILQHRSLSSVTPTVITGDSRLDPLALGVVGMDNRQAVIIDIGAVLTKVGYAGEFVPRAIIRTELLDDRTGETVKVLDDNLSEQELYYRLVKFFRELFFRHLLTVAKDRRIVIVESILKRTSYRNAIARVLFNTFDAPSVLFAPSHLLATFPFGVSNALVIDVGYSETTVVPILEGVTMLYQLETSCIGAKYLEKRVYELLRKYGKVLTLLGTERSLTDDDDILLKKEHILEDIVVRFCFATRMDRGKMIQASEYNPEREIPKAPCDVRLPFGEGMLVVPGLIREWSAEIIFEENDDIKSLPQLILDAIYRCPIDARRKLLDSIILIGGTTRMKGFSARLRDEILRSLTASAYAIKLGNIKSVKFYRLPNTSIELYASWIGGSMFGALEILQYHSLTREDWEARGRVPDWTNNVYEMNRDPTKSR